MNTSVGSNGAKTNPTPLNPTLTTPCKDLPAEMLKPAHPSDGLILQDISFNSTSGARDGFAPLVQHAHLKTHEPIPPLARDHLRAYPYQSPEKAQECRLWYEGTFDPLGPHHLDIFLHTLKLGFERATLGIVYQNPYKPDSTPYQHRYEMARRVLQEWGLPIVHNPNEPGICLFRPDQEIAFHQHRMNTLFASNAYILIGPDNFEKALQQNVLWVHPTEIAGNPGAPDYFGFRSMYDKLPGFKRRILVYPVLHDIHSTNLRNGEVDSLPVVEAYAKEHNLYEKKQATPTASEGRPLLKISRRELRTAEDLLHRSKVEHQINMGLSRLGIVGDNVERAVAEAIATLDSSRLIEAEAHVKLGDDALMARATPSIEHCSHIGKATWHRPNPTLRRIQEHLSARLLGDELQVRGNEEILNQFQAGKSFIFIGNQTGWDVGNMTLLSTALRHYRMSAVADQLTFVHRISELPTGVGFPIFAKSVGRIEIAEPPSAEDLGQCIEEAVNAGLKRLKKNKEKAVFYSPEGPGDRTRGLTPFSPFFIRSFLSEHGDALNSATVVVPVALSGNLHHSEENPISVSFGAPMAIDVIRRLVENTNDEVAAHVLGTLVAELLPVESRGVYSDHAQRFDQDGFIDSLSQPSVEGIKHAREIVRSQF